MAESSTVSRKSDVQKILRAFRNGKIKVIQPKFVVEQGWRARATIDKQMLQMLFEQGYFENSCYSNYLKYNDRCYDRLAATLASECAMQTKDVIVDYGCATGILISSFRKLGFKNLTGTDISYWAIEYGKREFRLTKELKHYNRNLLLVPKDWLIALDVLEHIPTNKELLLTLKLIQASTIRKGLIVRLPVSVNENEDFYLEVSRKDKTHFQKHCKHWWLKLFASFDFYPVKYFSSEPEIWDSTGVLAVLLGKLHRRRRNNDLSLAINIGPTGSLLQR